MEWIYRGIMRSRRATNLAKRGRAEAPCPIISVGNLTTGGTGKTPTVQWLAQALTHQGVAVGVATRGYGGSLSEKGALVSDGKTVFLNASEAGDETLLHAHRLPGTIVAMGINRHRAVDIAVEKGAEVVILDDGFQFWSLPRVFDLVLLDAQRPFGNGHFLPIGRLREEPEALARASVVLLTRTDRATPRELEHTQELVSEFTSAPMFQSSHQPTGLRDERTGEVLPLSFLQRRELKAFAGLADNAQFYAGLEKLGAGPIIKLRRERGDHHKWNSLDFRWMHANHINSHQTDLFDVLPVVTTEKDAVKLDPDWFKGRLLSLQISLKVDDESGLIRLIWDKLGFR